MDDKDLWFRRHPSSDGLSNEAVQEIVDACDMIKFESGEIVHKANDPFDTVYLLIHGRVKQTLLDIQGNVLLERFQTAGGQIGALAAALGEPSPINMVAVEPTTLLRLNYEKAMELTKKHDVFRQNFSRLIADSVRNVLMKDRRQKKPKLVAMFHQSAATRPITRKLIMRLRELGEHPNVMNDQTDWEPIGDVPYFCFYEDGQLVSREQVRDHLSLLSDAKRTFVDLDATIKTDRVSNILNFSDKIFWCVTPENWQASVPRLEAIIDQVPNWRDKINLIWLLDDGQLWAPLAPQLTERAKRVFKLTFADPPPNTSRELVNGIERIVHQLRGVRIGVALGGGAALGMAHLGVLKALEQNGIVVDMLAGTSAGAMTGIVYASGMEPDHCAACFVRDLTPSWLYRHLPSGGYWYLLSKYRRRKFDPMLRPYLKDSHLEQLIIPVHSVTVDLVAGQAVVRNQGDSVHAIMESINLPGLAVPINRDGRSLVDGGIVNNVPADVLVANGCNFVIAVSVTAQMEKEFAKNRPDTPTSKMHSASTLKTLIRTYLVQHVNMNSIGVEPADYIIQPDMTGFDAAEFVRADEMAVIGEQTTTALIPEIKEMLSRIDDRLFASA